MGINFHGLEFDHVIKVDPGRCVVCDFCNKDWTDSPISGGILFGSKGTCPECQPRLEASAERYGEQEHIRGRCPPGVSFADWIRSIR